MTTKLNIWHGILGCTEIVIAAETETQAAHAVGTNPKKFKALFSLTEQENHCEAARANAGIPLEVMLCGNYVRREVI